MKISCPLVVCAITVILSLSCASAYGEDEIKKLYLDGGGGQIADMAYYYLDGGTKVNCKWIQGSDLSISGKNARIDPVSKGGTIVHGLEYASSAFFGFIENSLLKLGEGGITLANTSAAIRWDGNRTCAIVLTGDQTWTTASGASNFGQIILPRSDFFAAATYQPGGTWSTVGTVSTEGPVRLNVTGRTDLNYRANGELADCDITVTAPAKISVGRDFFTEQAFLNAKSLTLDGSAGTFYNPVASSDANQLNVARTLVLRNGGSATFVKHAILDASRIVVDAGTATVSGSVELPAEGPTLELNAGTTLNLGLKSNVAFDADGNVLQALPLVGAGALVLTEGFVRVVPDGAFGGTIRVAGGTLALPAMSAWPAGLTVVTEGSGTVLLDSQDGFDPARLTGTARQTLVITDETYPEDELVLNPGDCVVVRGNGLTAEKRVSLYGGELLFARPATVAAPIRVRGTGASVRTSHESVTATLAGFLAITDLTTQVEFSLCGPGTNVLAGGGLIVGNAQSTTYFTEGYGVISNGTIKLGWYDAATTPAGSFGVRGGNRLTVCNKGDVYLTQLLGNGTTYLKVGSASAAGDELLITDGGTVRLNNNAQLYVGESGNRTGTVVVDGGTLSLNGGGGDCRLGGYDDYGSGTIVVRRGTFGNTRNIKGVYDPRYGVGRLVLDGGTYKLLNGFGGSTYTPPRIFNHKACRLEVTEAGGTIDFSSVAAAVTTVTNNPYFDSTCAWTGAGTLRLVGRANTPLEFIVKSPTNAMGVAVADLAYAPEKNVKLSFWGVEEAAGVKVKGIRPLASTATIAAQRPSGTALPLEVGTLEFTDATVLEPPAFSAVGVTVDAVAVRAGGAFAAGAYAARADVTVGDVAFDTGSVLSIPAGATQRLDPTGSVTLPDALGYFCDRSANLASPHAVMSGVDPSATLPVWTPQPRSRKLDFSVVDGVLTASKLGMLLLMR